MGKNKNGKIFVSILGILANVLLAIGKTVIGIISKSSVILADGINSVTDVFASIINLIGVKASEKPADKEHPYGHEKAEAITGFVISIIIFLTALFIIFDSIRSIVYPSFLEIGILGFTVMGISALVNGVMSELKIRTGKKYDSVSLISDGNHSRIDLLISLCIFTSLFFMQYYSRIDSILALLVGIYVLIKSFSLGQETIDLLLGKSDGDAEKEIRKILEKNNIEVASIKTQNTGCKVSTEIKIKLPSNLKVSDVEKITKKLNKELKQEISNLKHVSLEVKKS